MAADSSNYGVSVFIDKLSKQCRIFIAACLGSNVVFQFGTAPKFTYHLF